MANPLRHLWFPLLILALLANSALGQVIDTPAPAPSSPEWIDRIYSAVVNGEWKLVAGLGLSAIAFALRTWGAKVLPWFATKLGGTALTFGISIAGTIGIALAAGAKVNLATILTALSTAASAAGIWEWIKSLSPAIKAKNEETKAAAGAKA